MPSQQAHTPAQIGNLEAKFASFLLHVVYVFIKTSSLAYYSEFSRKRPRGSNQPWSQLCEPFGSLINEVADCFEKLHICEQILLLKETIKWEIIP